jgi:2'-5' RNA ligase
VKFAEKNNNIPAIVEKFKSAEFGILKLNKFSLYKSTLKPNGPIYEVLKSFPLQ